MLTPEGKRKGTIKKWKSFSKKNDWRWRNRLAIKQYLVCEKNVKKKPIMTTRTKTQTGVVDVVECSYSPIPREVETGEFLELHSYSV